MNPAPSVTFLSVSLEAWLTIAAILVGPLAALLIQKHREKRRAEIDRKIKIFRDLMANRASRLSQPYVQALNGIEIEFYGDTKVIEAWHAMIEHLYTPEPSEPVAHGQWSERVNDRLIELLYEMAELLDYHFDKVTLKRYVYYPKGWNTIEAENIQLRRAAIKTFEGEKPLKVEIINSSTSGR